MKITVFGGGYVGLSSGAVLAQKHGVTIVDIDSTKVKMINSGKTPIAEKGLEELLNEGIASGRLKAVGENHLHQEQDAVLISVDTPSRDDGSVDLSNVVSVVDAIDANLDQFLGDYLLIGMRSTVPPTTTRTLLFERFKAYIEQGNIGIVFQPEFLRQGYAVEDLQRPDRVIIGAIDNHSYDFYTKLILPTLESDDVQIIRMEIESAEMCKYASNSYLATKISFVNELCSLAEKLPRVNIDEVVAGMVADHRISPSHLNPGLGYGGSCLPKDTQGLINFGEKEGLQMNLLNAVHFVNEQTVERLLSLFGDYLPKLGKKKVTVLGLAFKAGTDDTRKSFSLPLIEALNNEGIDVYVHDPVVDMNNAQLNTGVEFHICDSVEDCTKDAYALVLMTDWEQYLNAGIEKLTMNMKEKLVIDGRRSFVDSTIPKDVIYRPIGKCLD